MTEQEMLKRKIYANSFASWELHLFLDSHPNNKDAATKLETIRRRIDTLTKEYEEKYGTVTEVSNNTSRWQWVNGAWPWELEE